MVLVAAFGSGWGLERIDGCVARWGLQSEWGMNVISDSSLRTFAFRTKVVGELYKDYRKKNKWNN